jgi:hypothetical protein
MKSPSKKKTPIATEITDALSRLQVSPKRNPKRKMDNRERQQGAALIQELIGQTKNMKPDLRIELLSLLDDERLVFLAKEGVGKIKNEAITALKMRMEYYDKEASRYWMMESASDSLEDTMYKYRMFYKYATPLLKLVRDSREGGVPRGLQIQCEKFGYKYGLIQHM